MKIANKMSIILSICAFIMFSFYGVDENVLFAGVETGTNVGQKAPAFKLSNINGEDLDLESFRKGKTILLVFGATWCPSCRHEVPYLNEYYNDFKGRNFEVININLGESEKKVRAFVKKNKIEYNVVLDTDSYVALTYKVSGIPLNIVVDKEGIIRYREYDMPSRDVLKKFIAN